MTQPEPVPSAVSPAAPLDLAGAWVQLQVVTRSGYELEQALQAADAETKTKRRMLGDATKKLREVPMEARGKEIGPLLKLYQGEIDRLIKRGTKASKAYYHLLATSKELQAQATIGGTDVLAAAIADVHAGAVVQAQSIASENLASEEDAFAAVKLGAFERTLAQIEQELSLETPPATPRTPGGDAEYYSRRLRRLSSGGSGGGAGSGTTAVTGTGQESLPAKIAQLEQERDARVAQLEQVTTAMEREVCAAARDPIT